MERKNNIQTRVDNLEKEMISISNTFLLAAFLSAILILNNTSLTSLEKAGSLLFSVASLCLLSFVFRSCKIK